MKLHLAALLLATAIPMAASADEETLCFTNLLGDSATEPAAAAPLDFSEIVITSEPPLEWDGLIMAGEPLHNPIREEIAAELELANACDDGTDCPQQCTELGTPNGAPCPCDLAPTIAAGRQKVKTKSKGPAILPDTAAPPVRVEYLDVSESSTSCTTGSCGKTKRGWFKRRR